MAGAGGQHHPSGAAGGAAAAAGAAVAPATASAGPGEDSSDSEAEQEGPQKLIRKVSTSGQIRTKVRRAQGERGRREAAGRGRGEWAPGAQGDPGKVWSRGEGGAWARRRGLGEPDGAPQKGISRPARWGLQGGFRGRWVGRGGGERNQGAWEKAETLFRVPTQGSKKECFIFVTTCRAMAR